MPDIFLSYSSKDRPVAERIQARLAAEGYDVFWDQTTPPGVDWDTWIRGKLADSGCVIVLWSKTSVASSNVRHEAMIGRDAAKLLPVMIDDLDPTDFPMGFLLVQALTVGRTKRSLSANWDKLLVEIRAKLAAGPTPPERGRGAGIPSRRNPRALRGRRALIVGIVAALAIIGAITQAGSLLILLDPARPPLAAERVQDSIAGERLAKERVVRSAEEALTAGRQRSGSSWVWLTAQLISAAPEEARGIAPLFFQYLFSEERPECRCFFAEDIPHAVANAWVVTAFSRFKRPVPAPLLQSILSSQSPEGWWAISLTATRDTANAAVHATALLTIALAQARDAGVVPAELRQSVDNAITRSTTWLNRGPEDGSTWADYPNNERRVENISFAAMAAVASHLGGQSDGRAARAFRRAAADLPGLTDSFPSGSYVELADQQRYIDKYRHPTSPWVGAAAVMTYAGGTIGERRSLRRIIRAWISADIGDERLLRQDWMTGETLFLRALALPPLAAENG